MLQITLILVLYTFIKWRLYLETSNGNKMTYANKMPLILFRLSTQPNKSPAVAEMDDRLATIYITWAEKRGLLCPFQGGELGPI